MNGPWIHETERYRFATRADLPDYTRLLSDAEVCRWLWFAPLTADTVEQFFGPLIDRQTEQLAAGEAPRTAVFTVEDLEASFLGHGAVVEIDGSPGGCEIGFQLGPITWGRGVGTRLGQFLCAYAVERCEAYRIEAGCLEGNAASRALLQKLGLILEGTRPGYRLKQDVRHTELCFGREVRELDAAAIRAVAGTTKLLRE